MFSGDSEHTFSFPPLEGVQEISQFIYSHPQLFLEQLIGVNKSVAGLLDDLN